MCIRDRVYSTYQAVSGSGVGGIKDLENWINGGENKKYPHQIAYNCLPHIDEFLDNDYTKEEMKMINETKKILNDDSIRVTATTVRVPVKYGHWVSINLEFENPFEMDQIYKLLQETEGVIIVDDVKNNVYPCLLYTSGASHESIEDMAIMRAIPNLTVLVPADGVEAEQMILEAAKFNGPMYVRLGRSAVPTIFDENYKFQIDVYKRQMLYSNSWW